MNRKPVVIVLAVVALALLAGVVTSVNKANSPDLPEYTPGKPPWETGGSADPRAPVPNDYNPRR